MYLVIEKTPRNIEYIDSNLMINIEKVYIIDPLISSILNVEVMLIYFGYLFLNLTALYFE
jgi:hypothetical protein